jgi:LysM repeat protein
MKKRTVFLAAGIGAAMLTGCGPGVMGDRYYKNTDGAVTTVPEANIIEPAEQSVAVPSTPSPVEGTKAPEQKSTFRTYEPMQQLDSDKIAGLGDAKTGKAVKSTGKTADAGKRVYKVRRGDTPSGIAIRHRVSLSALMEANNLTESDAKKLRVGQKLVIPAAGAKKAVAGKKAKTVKAAKVAQKTAAAKTVATAALDADGTYSVKRGDSPERIARKFKVKLSDLLKANSLDEAASRRLQVGQKLIIPGSTVTKTATPAEKVETKATETTVTPQDTTTQATDTTAPAIPDAPAVSGDDLAKKLEGAAPAADSLNGDVSETGNIVSHIIQNEISLADFAAQQKTTVEELKRINSRPLPDVLKQNDVVYIPFGK